MGRTLFERIGGDKTVKATVARLYDKILGDPDLAPFFENVDVEVLRRSQTAFVTYAFGGTDTYSGRNLRVVHAAAVQKGLSDLHFDRVAEYLADSLQEMGVAPDLIGEALTIVGSTRKDVLNR
jgi:hemoglobin